MWCGYFFLNAAWHKQIRNSSTDPTLNKVNISFTVTSYGRKFDLVVSMMIIHLNPGDDLAIFLEYFN